MALSAELFQEILDDDVLVDKHKLIESAKYGIPESIRSRVWLYLLDVSSSSQQAEAQQAERRLQYYKSLRPTMFLSIKNAVNTVVHDLSIAESTLTASVSNILCSYFSCDPNIHFTPGIVNLTVSLYIGAHRDEVTAFFMLTKFLDRFYSSIDSGCYARHAAVLVKYINMFMPELVNHFASEALDIDEAFVHWFQYLHSTALPIPCVLRLWDSYLASKPDEVLSTALFVSLALVDRFTAKMLRMEHLEIQRFLSHLPAIDIDVVLIQAESLHAQYESVFQTELPEDGYAEAARVPFYE
jgi:hypothetical protein